MKDSSSYARDASNKKIPKEVLFNTKDQYKKKSNTLAENVIIKDLLKEIVLSIKG